MKTVNIHEAKTQLSKLIEEPARGEPFVIAKAGKPVGRVTARGEPTGAQIRRLGFLEGQNSGPHAVARMIGVRVDGTVCWSHTDSVGNSPWQFGDHNSLRTPNAVLAIAAD